MYLTYVRKWAKVSSVEPEDMIRTAVDFINAAGLEKTEIAHAAGVSPSCLSRWLAGKRKPAPDVARRVVDATLVVWRASEHRRTDRICELLRTRLENGDDSNVEPAAT